MHDSGCLLLVVVLPFRLVSRLLTVIGRVTKGEWR
jgi:hypothetical protein